MPTNIIDGHVHIRSATQIDEFDALAKTLGLESIGLLCMERDSGGHDNVGGFLAKKRRPGFFYMFGGLDHHDLNGGPVPGAELAAQVERLHAAGCDGIKLIESKPATWRKVGHPLDSDYFAPAFRRIAALDIPLLWHVADPEEFWDPKAIPSWAAERGWGYDKHDPTKEALYEETFAVLRRHPSLRVIFAHFCFLSGDLERAAEIFDAFPGVCFDLAPGVEMFYNLSRDREGARDFFTRYADRIVYGTDLGIFPGEPPATSLARAELVLRFLRTDDEYRVPPEADFLLGPPEDGVIRGIALEEDALAQILKENYRRTTGAAPRPLDASIAATECRRYAERLERAGAEEELSQVLEELDEIES